MKPTNKGVLSWVRLSSFSPIVRRSAVCLLFPLMEELLCFADFELRNDELLNFQIVSILGINPLHESHSPV